jgi:uncharacterized protein (TIGR03435 family)
MLGELTNHLWQSTLFAAAAALLALAFRHNQAQVRYWLWLSASIKFFVPFSLLMSLGSHLEWVHPAQQGEAVALRMLQVSIPFPNVIRSAPALAEAPPALHWGWAILAVWGCGILAVAVTRLRVWLRVREALRRSTPMDFPAAIPVRSSPGLLEPGVVGLWRPVMLLPASIAERLTPGQLQAVIAHEIWHVRRRDNLYATIHMLAEAVFWFHPLVWWIGARLVEEREQACDEGVLTLGSAPQVYAEAIVNVCKLYVESPMACVAGVTGADLKRRIEAIMTNRTGQKLNRTRKFVLGAAGTAALAGPLLIGIGNASVIRSQSEVRPSFAVATIKPSDPQAKGRLIQDPVNDPKFISRGLSLSDLIQFAYGVHADLILRAPGWAFSDRYDIEARADGPGIASQDQRKAMLKTLLADRFALTMHREPKQVSIYLLTVARDGPKMKRHDPPDGGQRMSFFFRGPNVPGRDVSMPKLAGALQAMVFDRPVLDRTGLAGEWDFDLKWSPDDNQFGGNFRGANPDSPPIFAALQEQLGLKLEPQKTSMDALIVDHAEKPSDN